MSLKVNGVEKAIENAGGAQQFAARLGVSHQAVYQWRKKGWVPTKRVLQVEKLFGVEREELAGPHLLRILT
ncbi:hypothetical protein [Caulobacter phage KcrB]|nr:hypothetical protein RW_GP050 [Caulobacter phage RW]WCA46354.1 hypothetical protein [Caulobacter phage KcrB]WCD56289.1 hypothetical protein [Caulobacter phage RLK]WNV48081.1 transcriptional repressor [Caulobacter phage GB2A]